MADFIEHQHAGTSYRHPVVRPEQDGPSPTIILVPDYHGCTDYARATAEQWARRGHVGVVMDLYGDAGMPPTGPEAGQAIQPHFADRHANVDLMQVIIDRIKEDPGVDPDRIVVIGYSSGGCFSLDIARTGMDVLGCISYWGVIMPLDNVPPPMQDATPVKASVLVIQGYRDDFVPTSSMKALTDDLDRRDADFQVHLIGGAKHAFSLKQEDNLEIRSGENPTLLLYDEVATARADALCVQFVQELLDRTT